MTPRADNALTALERARQAQERHERRIDVQLRLPCGCLKGIQTNDEDHEDWCPTVTGSYDGLPRISL